MKAKKSEKANLENKRGLYFQLGLIISLCITLSAFEWSSSDGTKQRLKGSLEEEPYLVDVFIEPQQKQQKSNANSTAQKTKPSTTIKIEKKKKESNELDTSLFIDEFKIGEGEDTKPVIEKITFTPKPNIYNGHEVDFSPEFPGGQEALRVFINENLNIPQIDIDRGVSSKVYLSFVINSKGEVVDVTFEKGKASSQLKKETIRMLNSMPNWKPGEKKGKAVSVKQYIPINVLVK